MERGGEGKAAPTAVPAGNEPEWSFGGDVDGLGPDIVDHPADDAWSGQCQPDLRIGRAGKVLELIGRQQRYVVAEGDELMPERVERSNDAIDLG